MLLTYTGHIHGSDGGNRSASAIKVDIKVGGDFEATGAVTVSVIQDRLEVGSRGVRHSPVGKLNNRSKHLV
jgi:hypothetical protein